jgi:hypothetical protein
MKRRNGKEESGTERKEVDKEKDEDKGIRERGEVRIFVVDEISESRSVDDIET